MAVEHAGVISEDAAATSSSFGNVCDHLFVTIITNTECMDSSLVFDFPSLLDDFLWIFNCTISQDEYSPLEILLIKLLLFRCTR